MIDDLISKKEIQSINLAEIPKDYAKFLACGFDSIQESYNLTIKDNIAEILFRLKYIAEAENHPVSLPPEFNTDLQMMPIGASGFTYRLENDRFQILIRNPAGMQKDWQISVRYLAYGLWMRGGIEVLKKDVLDIVEKLCYEPNSEDWQHITRADFCFDFHSSEFDKEMIPEILYNVVATSRAKQFTNSKIELNSVARNQKIETITIGSKKSLQISVYDKTKEITEASGKTWFYEIWGNSYDDCVYRVEVRMSKEWLKDRNILNFNQLKDNLKELLNDALIFRRIAKPSKDTNKSRWKIHPLWGLCFNAIHNPSQIVKIGRYVSQRKEYLEKSLIDGATGCLRSLIALRAEKFDDNQMVEAVKEVVNGLIDDPKRDKKISETNERYKFVQKEAV